MAQWRKTPMMTEQTETITLNIADPQQLRQALGMISDNLKHVGEAISTLASVIGIAAHAIDLADSPDASLARFCTNRSR
jgi:hypothetical protein